MRRYGEPMDEMNETVRRVAQALLDTQTAFDPDEDSAGPVGLTLDNLLSIPGAVTIVNRGAAAPVADVNGLIAGTNFLIGRLLTRLERAEGQDPEIIIAELRETVDDYLSLS